MSEDDGDQVLIPVHAAMDCAAAFGEEEVGVEQQEEHSLPLAVLDFERFPRAGALFGTFIDESSVVPFVATVEPWVPLADEEPDSYDRLHEGEPLLHFLISRAVVTAQPAEALSFRVCIQHEAGFMQQVTAADQLGVMGAVPDGIDADAEGLLAPILAVSIDPGYVGYAELMAWRLHYTN